MPNPVLEAKINAAFPTGMPSPQQVGEVRRFIVSLFFDVQKDGAAPDYRILRAFMGQGLGGVFDAVIADPKPDRRDQADSGDGHEFKLFRD